MLNKSKKGNNKIPLKLKDNLVDDDAEVASAFNEFFCSIAQNLQDKIPDYGNFQDYVTGLKSSNSFFFTAVTKSEMSKVIKSLNFTKGTGDFSIPKKVFKLIPNELTEILTLLINLTFETGIFPTSLKIVKVIPIFKNKGSNQDVKNFRPISLLSNIDKKLVHSRLTSFFLKHKLFFSKQFGFRKSHSTNQALITLTEQSLDKGECLRVLVVCLLICKKLLTLWITISFYANLNSMA